MTKSSVIRYVHSSQDMVTNVPFILLPEEGMKFVNVAGIGQSQVTQEDGSSDPNFTAPAYTPPETPWASVEILQVYTGARGTTSGFRCLA